MSFDLRISSYSTALYATWVFVDQWKLLLDAGDGVTAGLMSKLRRVRTVALTHPDRDHLTGMLQLLQLQGREMAQVCYPRDAGSFPALADFAQRFDPGCSDQVRWQPVAPGDTLALQDNLYIEVLPNRHWRDVPATVVKTVSYRVCRRTQVLRPELRGAPQATLDQLRLTQGREALVTDHVEELLTYTGDTPVVDAAAWGHPQILIHESTFLEDAAAEQSTRRNVHSALPAVLELAAQVNPHALILIHFSTRYAVEQIRQAVRDCATAQRIAFPIWIVPPGEVVRDLFRTEAVWEG